MSHTLRLSTLCAAAFLLGSFATRAATMTDLGILTGGNYSYAFGVSANRSVIVGYASTSNGDYHAFKYAGTTLTDLGTLTGGNASRAKGVSADGSVIVGRSNVLVGSSRQDRAFKYTGTTLTDLGTFTGGNYSTANGVSADGSVIVGQSNVLGGQYHAFKYTGTTMTDLGTLTGGDNSSAIGVSANGSVIVGYANVLVGSSRQYHAFKYTGTTMTDLGTLTGGDYSSATGVSADGSVIVGYASTSNGDYRAFKYTGTTMTDLGTLTGGDYSEARGVSANGSVIVGYSNVLVGSSRQEHAFKYTGTTMTDLGTLTGGDSSYATGVSADGSVIVGYSNVLVGSSLQYHAFLYADATMLDIPSWMASVNGSRSVVATADQLFKLALEGAHHRTLMSYDTMGKENQAWVTGDFGSSSRKTDSSVTSGEAGLAKTFAPGLMAGIAFGTAQQNGDLALGGSSHLAGNYVLGEVDYLLPGTKSIVSLVVALGRYDADFNRGYDTGSGTQYSAGSTSVQMRSVRLRFDGPAYEAGLGVTVSPYISYALSQSSADAYAETGGTFAASYDALRYTTRDGRLGFTASKQVDPVTKVLFTAEVIHRFDSSTPALTGIDITNSLAFSAPGVAPTRNQARVGFDVDRKLSADTLLSLSLHLAGVGESPDVQAAVSIRRAF